MDYCAAISYLHSLHRFGMQLGLERMESLLQRLGDPHHACRAIHVAGTNGKGSVTAMVASIMATAGYATGRYISPYLERFSERICLNGQEISDGDLARLVTELALQVDRMAAQGEEHPTEFEAVTALALAYFHERQVDIVSLEVGLGGRYDATNVVDAEVCVITNIGWDHMRELGDSLEKIAWEKAGIIKPQSRVVTGVRGRALDVVESVARGLQAPVWKTGRDIVWQECQSSVSGQVITVQTPRSSYEELHLPLLGRHQQENAALAVAAVEAARERGFSVDEKAIRQGLKEVVWPGRLEILGANPIILIDGAHNPEGAQSLARALREVVPHRRLILVLGVLKDKKLQDMLRVLLPLAHEVIVTSPLSARALPPEELAQAVLTYGRPATLAAELPQALALALERAGPDDCVCVAGSLYLIGHARSLIRSGI